MIDKSSYAFQSLRPEIKSLLAALSERRKNSGTMVKICITNTGETFYYRTTMWVTETECYLLQRVEKSLRGVQEFPKFEVKIIGYEDKV